MAIQKPYSISLRGITIDANVPNEVTWKVSGDVQTAYKVDILLNSNNNIIWTSGKISSYSLKHTIPASTLTNGIEYKIKVTIWNQANNSITSDGDVFQTSSTPVVTVNNIGTVASFNYKFSATYQQSENVPLRSYIVNLYDSKKNLIDKSDIKTSLPLEHLFTNLQTETQYYIEFQATSSKGLTGTSGLVLFDVFYYRPKMNIDLLAKNIDNAGIEISWFVRQIIGETNGSRFINNQKVDTTNGTRVWFDEGFSISQDFTLKLWLETVPSKRNLLTMYGSNGNIALQYDAVKERFVLTKSIANGYSTSWASEEISSNSYYVFIQQIGSKMNISATIN
ncbi:hypothetical protein [Bacillus sp. AG4(2022)]|uniref:glycoside hydrolase family 78 protein n=1 Tax=Bacillus sp. AG4(2022) TaxID=2962594 RepID=UPI002881D88E|nr:hypothetical protein [Bacillus sp. AG4(2022)]MDT0160258.1 hypothetical protein [Bacillus sp. AG4(2022)]